jgi:hypothetical protein
VKRVLILLLGLATMVCAASPHDLLLSLQIYTQSDTILGQSSREDLQQIATDLRAESADRESLLRAGLELADKTVRDYAHLRNLQLELQQLAGDSYARELSGIEVGHFEQVREALDRLRARMDERRPEFEHPSRTLSASELDTLIDAHLVFFQDGSEATATSVKAELDRVLSGPAGKWDPAYESLVKRLNDGGQALSSDELKFVKIYGRVRMQVALIE